MSILSASGASSYDPSLTSASLPPIDQALEPADIRNGNAQAKQAYQEALGFEDMLMQQLTQQLASTISSPSDDSSLDGSDDSDDSSDSSDDSSGGILGSDPSTSAFASMIPQALTTSLMSAGGVGIAAQLAQSIDPQIGTPQGEASSASQSATSSAASTSTAGTQS
jgi:Rod binding domain-containing protein